MSQEERPGDREKLNSAGAGVGGVLRMGEWRYGVRYFMVF